MYPGFEGVVGWSDWLGGGGGVVVVVVVVMRWRRGGGGGGGEAVTGISCGFAEIAARILNPLVYALESPAQLYSP